MAYNSGIEEATIVAHNSGIEESTSWDNSANLKYQNYIPMKSVNTSILPPLTTSITSIQ